MQIINKFWSIQIVLGFIFFSNLIFAQVTLYTIGDSTMANKPSPKENPERGWAQMLPLFFGNEIIIDNRAVNGRSTRSFIFEKRWDSILRTLKNGDYVLIQFGHNDQKIKDPKRYTNPNTAYYSNLTRFVNETREKGAFPILFSSIVRRNFNENGTLVDTHGQYPFVARMVARELNVPFIDLQFLTEQMEESYGLENSKKLHLHFGPGEHPYYPQGKEDNTHLSILGATLVAQMVVQELRVQRLPLAKFLEK
ncbi:lysophospholipase L1-like esterase [Saonia flava]|uniref:Lysophospholipase L1-like esterase n=1 Tax=Saonia flava TaxID=523696 RepID=A0A846QUC1_9FLAO|nr:rhamnogalacturonan acetylesterase [Saonia flava]NJB71821.1 lysophospholipase L1-like esterase [Saonia flava]